MLSFLRDNLRSKAGKSKLYKVTSKYRHHNYINIKPLPEKYSD